MTLALLAAVITLLSLPGPWVQTTRVLRKRTIDGLSPTYLFLNMWSGIIWASYGGASGIALQIALNMSSAIAVAMVMGLALIRGWISRPSYLLMSAGFAVATAILVAAGVYALGIAATAIAIGCRLPQIVKAWREPGGIAVSIASMTIAGSCSSSWVLYALIVRDPFIAGTAAFNALFAFFVIARTYQGRRSQSQADSSLVAATT